MMKNDITYEYRVFTHRLIDLESMEVGICTSKVIKGLKPKDKVNGRFFHTSDTDEWFFCWNNELQKLNLKGNSDVNAALDEVKKLIANANDAVNEAKKIADEAKDAAADAQAAADAANAAVESIENKADKSVVDSLANVVNSKADAATVDALSTTVAGKADASTVKDLSDQVAAIKLDDYALKTDIPSLEGLATESFVGEEIAKLDIPTVPTNVSAFANDANYLTADAADLKYAPIGGEGVDLSDYAKKDFVAEEIAKLDIPTVPTNVSAFTNDAGYLTAHQDISGKQDVITDLDDIRANAALGASALQEVPEEYVTEEELNKKGYLTEHQDISGKQDVITDLDDIRTNAALGATALQSVPSEYVTETELEQKGYLTEHQSLDNYYTKDDIDGKIDAINALIDQAIDKTNTILGE